MEEFKLIMAAVQGATDGVVWVAVAYFSMSVLSDLIVASTFISIALICRGAFKAAFKQVKKDFCN